MAIGKWWLVVWLSLAAVVAHANSHSANSHSAQTLYDYMLGIRCVVCEGESVATSSSKTAAAMRTVITEQWRAGKTSKQIDTLLRATYGDGVFFRPPFYRRTWLLWLSPLLFGLVAIFFGLKVFYRWKK